MPKLIYTYCCLLQPIIMHGSKIPTVLQITKCLNMLMYQKEQLVSAYCLKTCT